MQQGGTCANILHLSLRVQIVSRTKLVLLTTKTGPHILHEAHKRLRSLGSLLPTSSGSYGLAGMSSETFYPVTGRSDTGKIALRLPIEELQTKDEQFSLFVVSMLIIQGRLDAISFLKLPENSQPVAANFYNIAAIHGKPYTEWLGDNKVKETDYSANNERDTLPIPSRFGGM